MKVRKGRKYVCVVNPFSNEVVICINTIRSSLFGYLSIITRNTVGLKIIDCTFNEIVYNCKVLTNKGMYLSKRSY